MGNRRILQISSNPQDTQTISRFWPVQLLALLYKRPPQMSTWDVEPWSAKRKHMILSYSTDPWQAPWCDKENVMPPFIQYFQNNITHAVSLKCPSQLLDFLICILDDYAVPLSSTSTCHSRFSSFSASLPCSQWTFSVIKSPCMSKWEPWYKCTLLVVSLPPILKGHSWVSGPGRKDSFNRRVWSLTDYVTKVS